MTPEKAIELLTHMLPCMKSPVLRPKQNAIKLGIEALKRIQSNREAGDIEQMELLPGETQE